ncbi:hypothetical protein, partial [Bacillus cereus]|uniref:hypothetical protein n=1 Tax=Bacillus cereus TaxID=1396 RepID=UPI001A7E61D7
YDSTERIAYFFILWGILFWYLDSDGVDSLFNIRVIYVVFSNYSLHNANDCLHFVSNHLQLQ